MGKTYKPENREKYERYWAKFEEIRVRCPKGTREKYRERAEELGLSLNAYAIRCMEEELERHREPQRATEAKERPKG